MSFQKFYRRQPNTALELVWPAIHRLQLDQLSSLEVQVVVDHVVMNQLLRSLFLSPYKEVHSLETVDLPS